MRTYASILIGIIGALLTLQLGYTISQWQFWVTIFVISLVGSIFTNLIIPDDE